MSKRSSRSLLVFGTAGVCCVGFVLLVAMMRLLGPDAPAQTPPTDPGATVVYNVPTDTPRPIATATQVLGLTRDHPHPMTSPVEIGDQVILSITFVTRPANDIVEAGNMFNDTPTADSEYLLVSLHLECTKPADQTCRFSTGEVKMVGANGTVRDQSFVAGIPDEMEYFNEFFGGSTLDGNLIFIATRGDVDAVLFYDPLIGGHPVYISLTQ